jgi:DNA-binding transcriptional LysR family regulator
MEWSSTGLRSLQTIAELGSFAAAAAAHGYTQSAVSRQMASLEHAAGAKLFERHAAGVRLTAAGLTLLRHASAALDEIDQAQRRLHGAEPGGGLVRLGVFVSAGVTLVPEALSLLQRRFPDVRVTTREASTPALTRSLRAGTSDIVVISSRPPYPAPDAQDPPLDIDVLLEGELVVAVPVSGDVGSDGTTTLAELQQLTWVSSPQVPGEPIGAG